MTFASSLRHRVKIYAPAAGEQPNGQPNIGRTLFAERWANIATTGGLETIKAGAVTSTVKASIRLRYCTDLRATMEVDHEAGGVTTTYRVHAVLPDLQKRIHVDLVCEINQ